MSILNLEKMTIGQKRFDVPELAELLDAAYMADNREPHDRAKVSFAPSGVGYGPGRCPRRWFYDFNGGIIREDSFTSSSIANMAYGSQAHERIQKLFENMGILEEAERKVISEDPPIFGFADLVINWQGEESVGEIKTTRQESYVSKAAKRQGAGYHLLQVLIYMKVLGLNQGFLLYENKNNQELLLLPIYWNEANIKLIDDTFNWMRKVRENWTTGTLPRRAFTQKSIECKACPFYTHCWNDAVGEVVIERLEVPK